MKPQGFLLDGTAVGGASGRGLHRVRPTCTAEILGDSVTCGLKWQRRCRLETKHLHWWRSLVTAPWAATPVNCSADSLLVVLRPDKPSNHFVKSICLRHQGRVVGIVNCWSRDSDRYMLVCTCSAVLRTLKKKNKEEWLLLWRGWKTWSQRFQS